MAHRSKAFLVGLLASTAIAAAAGAAPRNFRPDAELGASLAGTRAGGGADWKVENGEIVGVARGGGWLALGPQLQDAQLAAQFRCVGACSGGVLLRLEPTSGGMKGLLVSLAPDDLALYRVTFDRQGQETERTLLRPIGGNRRFASINADNVYVPPARPAPAGAAPAPPAVAAPAGPAGAGPGGPPGGGRRPPAAVLRSEWNEVEAIVDADILRATLNAVDLPSGDTADAATGFGQTALYVRSGEAHFKDVAYKDLRARGWGPAVTAKGYRMQNLSPFSYSYGADVGDINHDGVLDVISGPFYYPGPDYASEREIYPSETLNPGTIAPVAARMQYVHDFTGDGWDDVLRIGAGGGGGTLYVNPKTESRRWAKHDVLNISTELALFRDIDGDGRPEVIFGGGGVYSYASPDPANPTAKWPVRPISQAGQVVNHGMGVGDINRDGRLDFVAPGGWWEQPAQGAAPGPWTFHAGKFGGGGAEMCVYDINGDGRTDVVTSLEAHGWGLAWFEQRPDGAFAEHMIMGDFSTRNAGGVTFSELHGGACADLDGDGTTDMITGKRYWSHLENYSGPDPYGPPVLYVYKSRRNARAPGGAEFVPELINNRSGVGSTMVVRDLNKDGANDIVASSVLGVNILWADKAGSR